MNGREVGHTLTRGGDRAAHFVAPEIVPFAMQAVLSVAIIVLAGLSTLSFFRRIGMGEAAL